MTANPFFTIVIPSYNRAELLPRTIRSVQQQTFADFEMLIVDDGSKDNTNEIVSRYIKEDSRVQYLYQENNERGAARNNGIRNARGFFIIFFDSDDEMKRDYLKKLHDGIRKNEGFNFYATKYYFINKGKERPSSMTPLLQGAYGIEAVLKGNPFACNFCIRKENPALKLFVEDRNLATTEDWIFLVENLKQDKIFVIDTVGLYMHQHDERSMQQNQLLIERRLKATELLCSRIDFSEQERKTIWAYSYYFCSIHAYLDVNHRQALTFLRKAVALCGWNSAFLKAFMKFKIGRKAIVKFTTLLGR